MVFSEIVFILNNMGTAVSYMVLMHENMVYASQKIHDIWWSKMPQLFYDETTWFWILFISILFLPLMIIREMKHLTGFSILGFFTILTLTILIVAYTFDTSLVTMSEALPKLKFFRVRVTPKILANLF